VKGEGLDSLGCFLFPADGTGKLVCSQPLPIAWT